MSKNYLTQVVWLFVLTIILMLIISLIPPIEINYTTKQVDVLSSIRAENEGETASIQEVPKPTTKPATTVVDREVDNSSEAIQPDEETTPIIVNKPHKQGDTIIIEDYTHDNRGLSNFTRAIHKRKRLGRPVRVAFLGDSFIEADILTQNIREALQELYSGCGIGYIAMHSDFPGFRRSITQVDKGWETHSVSEDYEREYTSLPLQFHRAEGEGFTRFKGVTKLKYIDHWEVSTIGFIATTDATITMKTDSATHTYDVTASDKAQFISLPESTSLLEIKCNNPDVAMWGAWLDAHQGIAIDNISIRGYSGTTLQDIPSIRLNQLNENIPYDLIVLQYGLNRMTPSITQYAAYTTQLVDAVTHLQQAFPHTDILIMGIGDRCENKGGEMLTMDAIYGMIKAQRNAAIKSQCLFWDTYEAMKSLGGMPEFVNNKWANKDYTHISHAGGKPLSQEFVKAIKHATAQ